MRHSTRASFAVQQTAEPREREELEVKRSRLAFAAAAILALALGVVLISVHGSGGKRTERAAVHVDAEGLVSEGPARGDRDAHQARTGLAQAATASFGPNVLDGRFDGVSPAV